MASKMAAIKLKISVISASNRYEDTTFVCYDSGQVLSWGKLGGAQGAKQPETQKRPKRPAKLIKNDHKRVLADENGIHLWQKGDIFYAKNSVWKN